MRVTFRVSFELPRAATIPVARRYVEDAVRMMAGGLNDYDPMFAGRFDASTVEVTHVKDASHEESTTLGVTR